MQYVRFKCNLDENFYGDAMYQRQLDIWQNKSEKRNGKWYID